eukprot:jgi/Undpi1/2739/HiC_scaffold_14.g06117.m1
MREQAGAGGGGRNMGHERSHGGVRANLFDIFRFGPGDRDNFGVPKARWQHIHVKLLVSLEDLLTGVEKEVHIGDTVVERYRQAARTGLLSQVVQEGAAVFGALLLRCPLPVMQKGSAVLGALLPRCPLPLSAVAFAAYVHLKLPKVPDGTFKVPILPGYRRGTKITFSTPEGVEVTFELVEKPSQFRRSGDDLFLMVRISPKLAKRGCVVKTSVIRLKRGEAGDGYERRLPGLGMPKRKSDGEEEGARGDLIVHFIVEDKE